MVKNLPADAGDAGLIPGREGPLEEGMATHSCILAWRIWTEEPGGLQSVGSQRVGHDSSESTENASCPLQCSPGLAVEEEIFEAVSTG